jgi:hypothetical protein
LFEGWSRVVRGALDRRTERRRCDGHVESILGGHVEQSRRARVLDESFAGGDVALEHLGVGLRRDLAESVEHEADGGGPIVVG